MMNEIGKILDSIARAYAASNLATATLFAVLLVTLALSCYIWAVYRFISHRAFYNRAFHISVTVIPLFISTIVLSLQSNLVITLGTIGALAIIRFRTAVKDPVDMIYVLWAVHIGITCGCQLYEVAVFTSLLVTLVLLALEHIHPGLAPYTLVLHCRADAEAAVTEAVKGASKRMRLRSRSYAADGIDIVYEATVKDAQGLTARLTAMDAVDRFSLIEYDAENIL